MRNLPASRRSILRFISSEADVADAGTLTIAPQEHQTRPRGAGRPAGGAPTAHAVAQRAHELQAPLAVVRALCERLLDGDRLEPADADDVREIRTATVTVLERVEHLLGIARLGSERPALDLRRIDAAALMRRTLAAFEPLAAGRDQRIMSVGPLRLDACADEEKLGTVLSNLVVNALKFTPRRGLVRCTLSTRAGRVRVEVADTGPGIPPDLRDAIFEPRRRGLAEAAGGHGLGLAIVRELVELHGGAVTVGDAPEGGALFTVEIPREPGLPCSAHRAR